MTAPDTPANWTERPRSVPPWAGRDLPEPIAQAIGLQIRQLRESRQPDWSQRKAAEQLGMSQSALSDIEAGKKSPSLSTLFRLQLTFEVGSLEEVFGHLPSRLLAARLAAGE